MHAVHLELSELSARPSEIQEMIAKEAEKRSFPIKLEDRSVGRLPADSKRAWVMAEWIAWQETIVPKTKRIPVAAATGGAGGAGGAAASVAAAGASSSSSTEGNKRRRDETKDKDKLKQFKQSLEHTFELFEELRGKPMHYVKRDVVLTMFHS
jgi:hypothetical protein